MYIVPIGLKKKNSDDRQYNQQQSIELGSEILSESDPLQTNERIVKCTEAILVDGKEELPHNNICVEKNDSHDKKSSTRDQRLLERRRGRSRSLVQEKTPAVVLNRNFEEKSYSKLNNTYNYEETTNNNKTIDKQLERCATLPRRRRRRAHSSPFGPQPLPPHRVTPDGTAIYYWCELSRNTDSQGNIH